MDSPLSSIRWAPCTIRSSTASAMVLSPMISCQAGCPKADDQLSIYLESSRVVSLFRNYVINITGIYNLMEHSLFIMVQQVVIIQIYLYIHKPSRF